MNQGATLPNNNQMSTLSEKQKAANQNKKQYEHSRIKECNQHLL